MCFVALRVIALTLTFLFYWLTNAAEDVETKSETTKQGLAKED